MPKVGDVIHAENANWRFSGDTSLNFDGHAQKSIPLYAHGHDLVLKLSDFFLHDKGLCYDLGCSTGQLSRALGERHQSKSVRVIAIDSEADMVKQATNRCAGLADVSIRHDDLLTCELAAADLIVCYYTLQFISPAERQHAFDRIYRALKWGGALVMFEKVRHPDARFQDIATSMYTDFKLEQGYTGDEIVAKARSLKGVLEPFSTAGNMGLLERAGFVDVTTIFKYVCFEGFLAVK